MKIQKWDEINGTGSDIIAIRQSGIVSCHYVDSIGFK